MEENIVRLEYRDKEIILIGTAHVLKQSAELVQQVLDREKPDSICVELDEGRYQNMQNPKAWANTDVVRVIKDKKVGFLIANLFLSSYQKRIAHDLDSVVGAEMMQGIRSAQATGAALVLADRNIQVTFHRLWRSLSFWEKLKIFFSLVFSFGENSDVATTDISELLKTEVLESVMADVRKRFPKISEILISERDQHLAYKIKEAPGKKVVAILGAAHIPGVRTEIFKDQDIARITRIPPSGKPWLKIIAWAVPVVIVGLFIYGFAINIQTGLQQLSSWVLWNSALAALFTALALGHPLSILTAFVAAPFTSLNPFLACGWLAGLVEGTVRKPTVQDVNNIPQDIFSFKGIFRNRFLKVLVIVIMANIGSSIGTFVAGFDIVRNLF